MGKAENTALYLSYEQTTKLDIDPIEVIKVFEEAYRLIGEGGGIFHSRVRLAYPPVPDRGSGRPWKFDMRVLPAIIPGMGAGLRVGATASGVEGGGGFLIVFFESETMRLKAVISDHLIHGIRSVVPDGVAAKHLSRESSSTLGVIGSGRLARCATEMICAVRPIRRVKVYSPNAERRKRYCSYIRERLKVDVVDCPVPEPVVRDSDIVVAATNSRAAVLDGAWLAPGTTVISNRPEELDTTTLRRSRIALSFKEEIRSHVPPYPALAELLSAGELSELDDLAEMADILHGKKPGRTSEDEIITFLNAGCGTYDVAIGAYVYKRALAQGLGTFLPL